MAYRLWLILIYFIQWEGPKRTDMGKWEQWTLRKYPGRVGAMARLLVTASPVLEKMVKQGHHKFLVTAPCGWSHPEQGNTGLAARDFAIQSVRG